MEVTNIQVTCQAARAAKSARPNTALHPTMQLHPYGLGTLVTLTTRMLRTNRNFYCQSVLLGSKLFCYSRS